MGDKRLLILIPDRMTDLVIKGEYVDRYYNPGEVFDDVHIVMTNDDRPPAGALQRTVGRAKLHLHNLALPSPLRTLGRQNWLMREWLAGGLDLARQVRPHVLRTYGNTEHGYLAARIKENLGVPLLVSLHTHPDIDVRGSIPWWPSLLQRLMLERKRGFERACLRSADLVMPVYESLRSYATRMGARKVRVCYNLLNTDHLHRKSSYELHAPPRILSVGRQFSLKNPDNIIRALRGVDAELTMVGDGPLHAYLRRVADEAGVSDRVRFIPSLPNDDVCSMLPEFDVFATHVDAFGIAKAVMEPLLTGLPTIVNRRRPEPVAELEGDWVVRVENTPDGYRAALNAVLDRPDERRVLGERAYAYAQAHFAPEITEAVYAEVYREYLGQAA